MTTPTLGQFGWTVVGAVVSAGVAFFGTFAATQDERTIVAVTGLAFFNFLGVSLGINKAQEAQTAKAP